MKHRITAALERFSRAMLAPLSYLSAAGLLLVVGALLTSAPLAGVLPFLRWEPVQLAGRIIYKCLTAVISNLSVLFCTGLAASLAKQEKHQAAFIALMSYLVYLTAGNVTLTELGLLAQPDGLTGLYNERYFSRVLANLEKKIPLDWIDAEHYRLREPFFAYARPLIAEEVKPEYQKGLPRHLKLKR